MHLEEGQLKAYLDQELAPREKQQVGEHLEECAQCQSQLQTLANRSKGISWHLSTIKPSPALSPSPAEARRRLQARITEKERQTMLQKFFAPRYRPAWAALGLTLVLAVALAFPPVRAIANSFLGLFRVQQFSVVQINPGDLHEQLGASSQLEAMFTNNVHVEEKGEPQNVASAEEASQLAGIPVRLPPGMESPMDLRVMPGADISFDVDLQLTRALLAEIGRSDIQLPENLDGATVQVSMGSAVTAMYGECSFDLEEVDRQDYDPDNPRMPRLPQCTTFVQMPSPSISAPPGLDLQMIGEAFLQMLGMSEEEAAKFAQTVDWSTTLVIPIPRYGTTYQEVPVDGVTGTLIVQDAEDHANQYLLIWVKDGILYSLTGPGNGSSAVRIANSIN